MIFKANREIHANQVKTIIRTHYTLNKCLHYRLVHDKLEEVMKIERNESNEIIKVQYLNELNILQVLHELDRLFLYDVFDLKYLEEIIQKNILDESNMLVLCFYQKLSFEFIMKNELYRYSDSILYNIIEAQILSTDQIEILIRQCNNHYNSIGFINSLKTHDMIGEFRKRYCSRCHLEPQKCLSISCEERLMKMVLQS